MEKLKPSLELLGEYFENTPKEQIQADWDAVAEWDNIGPTVEEFLTTHSMITKVQMAMMSHLSDAQHLTEIGHTKDAVLRMNFVKHLILKYPNIDTEITWDELDKEWAYICERFGK